MHYKKQEEKKKQRRAEMAAKYPMTHPRENVSVVLTGSKRDYSSLINASAANRIAGNLKKAAENIWENMGAAAANYSAASKASADQIGRVASGQATNTWRNMGSAASNYSSALTDSADHTARFYRDTARVGGALESSRADANLQTSNAAANYLKQNGQKAWSHHVDNAREHSRLLGKNGEETADAVMKTYTDFYRNPNRGKMLAQTSGVLGSDQTGASFYGYQNDTSWKTPNDDWSESQLQQYQRIKPDKPELAEKYAANVNEAYNRLQKQKNEEQLRQQIKDSDYHAALHGGGARLTSGLKGLDGYNSMLEYAATGRMSTSPELTPGEYSQIVDDEIYNRLETEHGGKYAEAYQSGTEIFDSLVPYIVAGPTGDIVKSSLETGTDAMNRARSGGASDKEAAEYAFWNGVGNVAVDLGAGHTVDRLIEKIPESWTEKLTNTQIEVLKEAAQGGTSAFMNSIIEEYKKKGFSKEQSEKIAISELLRSGGEDALEGMMLSAAQRSFYESLCNNLKLK